MAEQVKTHAEIEDSFSIPSIESRYQRRSGGLPRLIDQPGATFSISTLPRPVAEPSGPVALLRNLLSV